MSLRIGILCHSGVGGSARVATELARDLARRDREVHVLARSAPPTLKRSGERVTLHCVHPEEGALDPHLDVKWNAADNDAFIAMAARAVADHRLDVLHFHYAIPFARLVRQVRDRLNGNAPALVGTLHGTDVHPHPPADLPGTLESLDALTTVSRSHAELAVRLLGLSGAPRIIANGVDLTRFRPCTAARRPGPPRILHVSNFRVVKDPARVAEAFVTLRRRRDAELWLVGDGEEMPRVRALLADGGRAADVRAFGLRTDVEGFYPQADVVVVTSRRESFSLVALEAAACGVPVVAPRVGGLPEIVADGRTGLLYDLDDPAEPAATLERLLADPARLEALGAAAVLRARAFSRGAATGRYDRLYREILRQRASRRVPEPLGAA